MEISPLLEIERGLTALIGGGGKTTLMFTLASELKRTGSVIICTSTHIRRPEGFSLITGDDISEVRKTLDKEGIIAVGKSAPDDKITAPDISFSELKEEADFVLVEADGARGLPLKAHAPHEPVIPENTDKTVLVIGADGFYKPVQEVCHRSEIWASLAGITADDPASPEGEAKVIIKEGFGDMVFINKAESDESKEAASKLAGCLSLPVVSGSLFMGEYKRWK